mgnify:FL=1
MVSKDEEVGVDCFEWAQLTADDRSTPTLHAFNEDVYKGKSFLIGRFSSTMAMDSSWKKEETSPIRKKAYRFFLRNGAIWRHSKR